MSNPVYFHGQCNIHASGLPTMSKTIVTQITFDAIDLRLLSLLQVDASPSNQDLAARAHVSPATCLRRVRRLTQLGVIRRRVALLDSDRLAPCIQAICEITLDRQGAEHIEAFEQVAAELWYRDLPHHPYRAALSPFAPQSALPTLDTCPHRTPG